MKDISKLSFSDKKKEIISHINMINKFDYKLILSDSDIDILVKLTTHLLNRPSSFSNVEYYTSTYGNLASMSGAKYCISLYTITENGHVRAFFNKLLLSEYMSLRRNEQIDKLL